jgi:hypothetical protein
MFETRGWLDARGLGQESRRNNGCTVIRYAVLESNRDFGLLGEDRQSDQETYALCDLRAQLRSLSWP